MLQNFLSSGPKIRTSIFDNNALSQFDNYSRTGSIQTIDFSSIIKIQISDQNNPFDIGITGYPSSSLIIKNDNNFNIYFSFEYFVIQNLQLDDFYKLFDFYFQFNSYSDQHYDTSYNTQNNLIFFSAMNAQAIFK